MDLIILIGIATSLLTLIVTFYFFTKKDKETKNAAAERVQNRVPVRLQEGVPRRAQIARNQRNRVRANEQNLARNDNDSGDHESGNELIDVPQPDLSGEKMGAKKRAKLEAKAEKKAHREVELKTREEKKKRDAIAEEERKELEEKEKAEELRLEEAERKVKEEKLQKEHEEYLKMKAAFSVEEEGFEEGEENDQENLLGEFIDYIKVNKIIVLEDLAVQFKLKTQAAIDRISDLQKDGRLTGVIDDRGKFIYISENELENVAKFIKQRGRISISELAESSNNLINLAPTIVTN